MKNYNKPEIETLALETVDVIAVSASKQALDYLKDQTTINLDGVDIDKLDKPIGDMDKNTWNW